MENSKSVLETLEKDRKKNFIKNFYTLLDSYKDISSFEKKIIFAQCSNWAKGKEDTLLQQTKLEKEAENFIIKRYKLNECYIEDTEETRQYMSMDVHTDYEEEYQCYLAGLKARQTHWHDLRINPDDLPDTDRNVLVKRESESECQIDNYYNDYYHDGTSKGWGIMFREGWNSDDVILWCELPKVEE